MTPRGGPDGPVGRVVILEVIPIDVFKLIDFFEFLHAWVIVNRFLNQQFPVGNRLAIQLKLGCRNKIC